MINTNIDLTKLIPQPDLRNLSDVSGLLEQVFGQPLKENLTVVHAVSVPTVKSLTFPLFLIEGREIKGLPGVFAPLIAKILRD